MKLEEIHKYLRTPGKLDLWYFPHQVAAELSDLAAILLYDLHVRTRNRKKPTKRLPPGWTYDPLRVFAANHPHSSEPGVRKGFLALAKAGYIKIERSGKYHGRSYDKKWCYHLTAKGTRACKGRLMRYHPNVAAALKIPKAVLLEAFRYLFHEKPGPEYIILDPSKLDVPYSEKTIGRHLDGLVEAGILALHNGHKHHYTVPAPVHHVVGQHWRELKKPITVSPDLLLPPLIPGEVGLLVGHSGTGKTVSVR